MAGAFWFVKESTAIEIRSDPPTTTASHYSLKSEIPLLPPLSLLRFVVAAGLILASALVWRHRLKNRVRLRKSATSTSALEARAIDGQAPDRNGEAEMV